MKTKMKDAHKTDDELWGAFAEAVNKRDQALEKLAKSHGRLTGDFALCEVEDNTMNIDKLDKLFEEEPTTQFQISMSSLDAELDKLCEPETKTVGCTKCFGRGVVSRFGGGTMKCQCQHPSGQKGRRIHKKRK